MSRAINIELYRFNLLSQANIVIMTDHRLTVITAQQYIFAVPLVPVLGSFAVQLVGAYTADQAYSDRCHAVTASSYSGTAKSGLHHHIG